MKAFIIAVVLLVAGYSDSVAGICGWRFDSVGTGQGNRQWTESQTAPCVNDGGNCKITPIYCPDVGVIVPAQGGGYQMTGSITSIGYTTVGVTPPVTGTMNVNGFTFKQGDAWMRITSCSDYPALVGVSVNMAGVTTNSQGQFTVFIPVYN